MEVGVGAGAEVGDDALRIDASGAVVIPGLVDGHVHAWEGALRGVSPDSGFYDYMALTHGTLGPLMTPEDIAIGQRVTALRALEQGVTTIIDNSHNAPTPDHSDAAVEALDRSGIRAVHASGVSFGQPGDHVHENLLRLRDRFESLPRLTLRLMEVGPTVDGWRFAQQHGFGAVAEFGFWTENLDELLASGLLGPHITLDHCAGLSDEQWKAVAASGAAVALVPRSDPHYGLGAVTPVLACNHHGIQEAISSDNEFEYGLDLFTEMRMLMTVQRGGAFAAADAHEPDAPTPYGVRDALACGNRRRGACCRSSGRYRETRRRSEGRPHPALAGPDAPGRVPSRCRGCLRIGGGRRHRRGRWNPSQVGRRARRGRSHCLSPGSRGKS